MTGDLLGLVGNTPMVPITIFSDAHPGAKVFAKAEFLNPGGSLKDRPMVRILSKAVERGELSDGKIVLDSTSGNAGIAYAMFGRVLGLKVELVVPGNTSRERLMRMRAHGALVILTDPLEGYDEALREVHRLYERDPQKYYLADQYGNDDNWLAHYETTSPEISEQVPEITHFVGGIGTGGSITGISRRLREYNRDVKIVSLRPERFPGIEGLKPLGEEGDIVPGILDDTLIDDYVEVTAERSRDFCHRLALGGLFVGQSSGANMAAVGEVLKDEPEACVVTLLNDTGERYLSTGLWESDS
ncbi:MAG: PLP-dependent cysteine synthase family protein [Fidelibacterota bacterium]